jgi:hypothetical protein
MAVLISHVLPTDWIDDSRRDHHRHNHGRQPDLAAGPELERKRSVSPHLLVSFRFVSTLRLSYIPGSIRSLPPLQSGSSYRTTLSVSPRPADSPALDLDFTANKLRRLLFGSDVSPTLPSSVNLAISSTSTSLSDCTSSLFALLQALNRQSRLLSLAQTFPLIPSALYPRIFTLYEPRSLDLLVSWRIPAQNRHGQSVLSTMLGPSESIFLGLDGGEGGPGGQAVIRSMFEETETAREALVTSVMASSLAVEQNPVRITVECPSTHQHDFNSGYVSVVLRLYIPLPAVPDPFNQLSITGQARFRSATVFQTRQPRLEHKSSLPFKILQVHRTFRSLPYSIVRVLTANPSLLAFP